MVTRRFSLKTLLGISILFVCSLAYTQAVSFASVSPLYLPVVFSPAVPPSDPVLLSIDNADMNSQYNVNWTSSSNITGFLLEEATEPSFSNARLVYSGLVPNWAVPNEGKTPSTYYYRVKAQYNNLESNYSDTQSITIYPLYVGLSLKWAGSGYIRGSEYHNIGYHQDTTVTGLTSGSIGNVHNSAWYDPNPLYIDPDIWDSFYDLVTGEFKSSSSPADPSRKWGEPWFLPYDFSLSDGQISYIDGIEFLATGPHQGVTAFGIPYSYWEMTNQQEFLFWDGGGDWTQRVSAGHIILRYDAGISRLQTYSDVKRSDFFQGNPTNDTVQYVTQLTAASSFSNGNSRVDIDTDFGMIKV